MKHQTIIFIALLSLVILIYILYLNETKPEGFLTSRDLVNMTTNVMSESQAHLKEISTKVKSLVHHKHAPPPLWKCNKMNGTIQLATQEECTSPNSKCMKKELAKQKCRYTPLPSSYWSNDNKYFRDSEDHKINKLEKEVDRLNLRHANIYIPPTINTCKRGCSLNTSVGTQNNQSQNLWKCSSNSSNLPNPINDSRTISDYYTTDNETDDYNYRLNNEDSCRNDIDCIWCGEVGILPIDTQSQAEIERKEKKKEESEYTW